MSQREAQENLTGGYSVTVADILMTYPIPAYRYGQVVYALPIPGTSSGRRKPKPPGGEGMDPGEQSTGTRDEQYNLVSVLYHALHGAETIETYVLDAEAARDERLASFFREAQAAYRQLAEQAKERLGVLEVPPEPEVAPDVPPEAGISPGAMAGGIPPEPADIQPGGAAPPLGAAAPAGAAPGASPGAPDVPPDIPPEGELPPDTARRDVPLGTEDVPPPGVPRTEGPAPGAGGVPPGTAPLEGDVPPLSDEVGREPGVRAEEVGAPTGGIPPTTDVPRTPPDAALPPDEDVVVEPEGVPPRDVPPGDELRRGISPEVPPREAPPAGVAEDTEAGVVPGRAPDVSPPAGTTGEPGLATPEERATTRPEEEEEEKGLLDKAKDKLTEARDRLTGQEEDRPPDRR
jgi:hypothetical protein